MMKKMHVFVAAILVLFVAWAFTAPAGAPKPEKGMLIGEVVDIVGYGMFGRLGKEHMEAGKYRASHGFPVGILEEVDGGHLDRPLQASSARSGYADGQRRPDSSHGNHGRCSRSEVSNEGSQPHSALPCE